jgi:A/G-specific adenine glycosylase
VFVESFPNWESIAAADSRTLEELLQPIGLWKRRSKSIRDLARAVGVLGGHLPQTRAGLEALPGVGQYVASAVLTLCHGGREPLLDTNMARVLERYFGPRQMADIRYDPYLQSLSREVLARGDPAQLNWGMLDLAAAVCVPRDPYCAACPLQTDCRFASLVGIRTWAWPPAHAHPAGSPPSQSSSSAHRRRVPPGGHRGSRSHRRRFLPVRLSLSQMDPAVPERGGCTHLTGESHQPRTPVQVPAQVLIESTAHRESFGSSRVPMP